MINPILFMLAENGRSGEGEMRRMWFGYAHQPGVGGDGEVEKTMD
ncbi:hypothetical protein [Nostoc sp. NIES-3756]|jgi:hypothetical protein|nr:hypothetical protein [Nostoc sp. NIES-3756]